MEAREAPDLSDEQISSMVHNMTLKELKENWYIQNNERNMNRIIVEIMQVLNDHKLEEYDEEFIDQFK